MNTQCTSIDKIRRFYILWVLILVLLGLSSCSHIRNFNAIEGKIMYEEHYATFNNVDYESGESENYGFSITNKNERIKEIKWDYSFFPDITFEQSQLVTRDATIRPMYQPLKMRRISAFFGTRGSLQTLLGNFEINIEVGPSYIEAYNDQLNTSKVEPTIRYEGVYTLFIYEGIYTGIAFTFQESPSTTYSEFYSLMYKLGYRF